MLNEQYLCEIPVGDCEFDEIWSFIQKNKNLALNYPVEHGDCWAFTAHKLQSGLTIAYSAGKQILETCEKMLTQLYSNTCIDYGQIVE